ncbi:MAG: helix-turn-helix transcriptional regulator, partial [Pseudomonadota bacterium]
DALVPAVFQDRAQRLTIAERAADAVFADAVASLPAAPAVRSIPVVGAEGVLPMVLHLIPVRGSAQDIFTQAIAILVATPVDRARVPTAEVLQGLFDLTPAEARVARGIGEAQSVDSIASALGVSRETVRSQLKEVLSKTGLSRQQELISLLAGKAIPAGREF